MVLKTIDDIDTDDMGAIGGAMGSWPLRTLWYLCRWERTNQTDENVITAIQQQNLDSLEGLANVAESKGIDTSKLESRKNALERADPGTLQSVLNEQYSDEYGMMEKCPYQQDGMDFSCYSCPVAGTALEELQNGGIRGTATGEGTENGSLTEVEK